MKQKQADSVVTILALPDTHVPDHSPAAVALARKVAQVIKPNHIVFLGDWIDAHSLSFYAKNPHKAHRLKQEVAQGASELAKFRGLSDTLTFCEGNHCERLQRYLAVRAPELYGLVEMHELLGVAASEWMPYRKAIKLGLTSFCHEVGFCGKNATRQSLDAFGGNLVIGHSHRACIEYSGNIRGERHFCVSSGWLGEVRKIDYMHPSQTRDWQVGVTVIKQDARGNSWATFVPFVKNSCVVDGKVIHV